MASNNASTIYTADISRDAELDTPMIALSSTDAHNPASNQLVYIAPELGSNWYRWRVGEHELLYTDQADLRQRGHTGVFVLWPFPNRVRERRYNYRGQNLTFTSVKRVTGALVHGLVYDLPWSHTQPRADEQSASVTTAVEITPDHPYYAAYPFASRLELTYTLTSTGLTVTYTVQNKGKQTLPYGFALHPYFRRSTDPGRTLVTLPAAHVMEADAELLPTGRLLDVQSTMYAMFDLNHPRPVDHLRLDHVYTTLPAQHEAMIDRLDLNLRLRLTTSADFTHAVIYTLGGNAFFCLENQTCSTDAINLAQRDMQEIAHLLEVEPGAEQSGFIRYAVEAYPNQSS